MVLWECFWGKRMEEGIHRMGRSRPQGGGGGGVALEINFGKRNILAAQPCPKNKGAPHLHKKQYSAQYITWLLLHSSYWRPLKSFLYSHCTPVWWKNREMENWFSKELCCRCDLKRKNIQLFFLQNSTRNWKSVSKKKKINFSVLKSSFLNKVGQYCLL